MSARETIYFKDLKPNRRSQEQFEEALKQLQPHLITHSSISTRENGFLVDYPHEKCANYIFITSIRDQLKALDLQAELAINTVTNRQIYLSNVPSDIYNKSIPELIDLLGQATGIRILKVDKFTSRRHFIVFIAESRVIRNEVFDKGTMVLAGHNIDPELPIIKNRSKTPNHYGLTPNYRSNHYVHRQQPTQQYTPPWGNRREQFQNYTSWNNHAHHNNEWPSLPNAHNRPPITRIFASECEMNFYIKQLDTTAKSIQGGLEHPEDYLNIVNHCNTIIGLPFLHVHSEQLKQSRQKFLSKIKDTNTSTPPTNNNPPSPSTPPFSTNNPNLTNRIENDTSMINETSPELDLSMGNDSSMINDSNTVLEVRDNDTSPELATSMENNPSTIIDPSSEVEISTQSDPSMDNDTIIVNSTNPLPSPLNDNQTPPSMEAITNTSPTTNNDSTPALSNGIGQSDPISLSNDNNK